MCVLAIENIHDLTTEYSATADLPGNYKQLEKLDKIQRNLCLSDITDNKQCRAGIPKARATSEVNLTRKLHLSSWRCFLEQEGSGRVWRSHGAEETEIKFQKV